MSYEMFDRLEAGRLCGGEASVDDLNVFSCDPGTVNTKMLLAGWGRCGIEACSERRVHHHDRRRRAKRG